eukprot:gene50404-68525_t
MSMAMAGLRRSLRPCSTARLQNVRTDLLRPAIAIHNS